jgi:ATP phosphoribosyltransferase
MVSQADRFCGALGVKVEPGVLSYQTMAGGLAVSIFLMKAPDVVWLLRRNLLDLGLTGDEWLMETGAPAHRRCFETRSYEASVCLLMAEGDGRPLGAFALWSRLIPIWPGIC